MSHIGLKLLAGVTAIITFSLIAFSPAKADWIGPTPMDLGWQHSNQIGLMAQLNYLSDDDEPDAPEQKKPQKTQQERKTSSKSAYDSKAMYFSSAISRRKANIAHYVATMRQRDPEGAAKMEQSAAQADLIALMNRGLEPFGFRKDNIADAYALWWIIAWQAYAKDYATPRKATFIAVRNQVEPLLVQTNAIAGAKNADKQRLTEDLILHAALIDVSTEKAKSDPAYAKLLSRAMQHAGTEMGHDFGKQRLTEAGFSSSR